MITDRQMKILHYLARHDELDVGRLSKLLQISPSTVRRELRAIERNGLLVRTHGAARLPQPVRYGPSYENRAAQQVAAKRAIAAAASRLITPGLVLGIMGGTTCTELARLLRVSENLTIVTNALNVALELQGHLDKRVMVIGGVLNQNSYELVGSLVSQSLQNVHLAVAFFGVSGISPEFGFSMSDEPEATAARAFMAATDRTVVIADHSKIGKTTFARLCPLTEADLLITDSRITPEQQVTLEKAGLEILVADQPDR